MLYYDRAIARERRLHARRIVSVNLGMAGGDNARRAVKELEDS